MFARPGRRLLAALLPLVLLTGCMGLAKSSDREAASEPETESVGDGVGLGVETTEVPDATSDAADAAAAAGGTIPPLPKEEGFANESTRTDPSGFKLVMTASGRMRYKTSEDPVFQLEIENVSGAPLRHDSNQTRFFIIKPADGRTKPVWADHMCTKQGKAYKSPALTLEPGDRVTLASTTYPASDIEESRESCRVLTPGTYQVAGLVMWCPAGSLDADDVCDSAKAKPVVSSPLTITFE